MCRQNGNFDLIRRLIREKVGLEIIDSKLKAFSLRASSFSNLKFLIFMKLTFFVTNKARKALIKLTALHTEKVPPDRRLSDVTKAPRGYVLIFSQ